MTGLPPSALELEITETVFQTGPATIESLRRLRALGVAIALDDFGIGYSSLTSLEQLPITRVKLDQQLVAKRGQQSALAAIVRSIVALCHGLGLQVVAEGVERNAQLEFLSRCGPIAVQGMLLAQPVEAAAAAREAQAAGARARLALEAALQQPRREGADPLVFFGSPARRRVPARSARELRDAGIARCESDRVNVAGCVLARTRSGSRHGIACPCELHRPTKSRLPSLASERRSTRREISRAPR